MQFSGPFYFSNDINTINEYLQRNKTIAVEKAESLNAEGNDLCHQEKYSEAIETYKAAIKITKSLQKENKLYEENKTNAEKKYEEQQQSLKLKQAASVKNESKAAEIKDLPEENIKEKLATFQNIVVEAISKLENSTTINEQDKAVLQDRINEISRTVKTFTNKADVDNMIKAVEELARGKITKAKIGVVEEDLNEIIEKQIKLEGCIRTEKLVVFQKVVEEMSTKVDNNKDISTKDKDIMQNSIKGIESKVQTIDKKTDIEIITESIKKFLSGKITKARLEVIAKLTLCKILNSVKMENGVVVAYNHLEALTLFGKQFCLFYVQFF